MTADTSNQRYTQGHRMEDAPSICSKCTKVRNIQIFGHGVPRHKNGQNYGQTLKVQWAPRARNLYRHPVCWPLLGNAVRGGFVGTWMWESTELGKSVCSSKTRTIPSWWQWNDVPANNNFKGSTLESAFSKLVMKLVLHLDRKEKETDGALDWKSMCPKLRRAVSLGGGCGFSDSDWLHQVYKESNKTKFQYCKNSYDVLLHIREIQGHTSGSSDRA